MFYTRCIKHGLISKCIAVFGACVATYFVYILTLFIFNHLFEKITFKKEEKNYEIVVYAILIIITIALSAFAFANSEAFWGTDHAYDIIYTSDSPSLVKGYAFLNLLHLENDLRQPLFSVFSAPFMGIPYFIGKLIFGFFNGGLFFILVDTIPYMAKDETTQKRSGARLICYSSSSPYAP